MNGIKSKVKKLSPVLKDYIWGGTWLKDNYNRGQNMDIVAESWELSIHPDGISFCDDGPISYYFEINPTAVNSHKRELPILIKYIDAKSNLSVQVHPTDEYAKINGIGNGKTEMWYIIHAEEGAGIYCGFNRSINKDVFLQLVESGKVESVLNFIPVKEGDCYIIKSGTVHAICAGCVICEVQQNSNTTYRIYDYNRKDADGNYRQLHINDAINVINFNEFKDETNCGKCVVAGENSIRVLTKCKYFRCRELILNNNYCEDASLSFIAVNVIDGEGTINNRAFVRGDSFFVPYGGTMELNGKAKILLTDNYDEGL